MIECPTHFPPSSSSFFLILLLVTSLSLSLSWLFSSLPCRLVSICNGLFIFTSRVCGVQPGAAWRYISLAAWSCLLVRLLDLSDPDLFSFLFFLSASSSSSSSSSSSFLAHYYYCRTCPYVAKSSSSSCVVWPIPLCYSLFSSPSLSILETCNNRG